MKKILTAVVVAAFSAMTAQAVLIAEWTFETSIPTTAGPHAAELGLGSALGGTGGGATVGAYSNPAGNASLESFSSNGWDLGDYWQFQVDLTGYENTLLTWDQTGSNTGPRDFGLSWSTDGSIFTAFGAVAPLTNDSWTTGGLPNPLSARSADLSSITAIENQATVFFRLATTSTTAITGGTVATTGTSRIDNFTVQASLIPEPGTLALLGIGLIGIAARRRR